MIILISSSVPIEYFSTPCLRRVIILFFIEIFLILSSSGLINSLNTTVGSVKNVYNFCKLYINPSVRSFSKS